MEKDRYSTNTLTAVILLVYVIAFYVDKGVFTIPIHLGGFSLDVIVRTIDLIAPVSSLLVCCGMFELIAKNERLSFEEKMEHLILPFAAAWGLGMAFRNTGSGWTWWVILVFGGVLLNLIFTSECILCDPNDPREQLTEIMITGLSYAAILFFFIVVRANIIRLASILPLEMIASFMISIRIFSIWFQNHSILIPSMIVSLIVTEASAVLHYYPLNAVSYGLFLFILFYSLENIEIQLQKDIPLKKAFGNQLPIMILFTFLFALTAIK